MKTDERVPKDWVNLTGVENIILNAVGSTVVEETRSENKDINHVTY